MKRILTSITTLLLFSSCFLHYFNVSATNEWNYTQLAAYKQLGKVFVVHSRTGAATLVDPSFESNIITGGLTPYSSLSVRKKSRPYAGEEPTDKGVRYRSSHKERVLSEIHIDISDSVFAGDSLTISKENFVRVREYKHDGGATTISWVGGILGISMIVMVIALFNSGIGFAG